jgi:hypothetical protein
LTAYQCFLRSCSGGASGGISATAARWKELSLEERRPYEEAATEDRKRYEAERREYMERMAAAVACPSAEERDVFLHSSHMNARHALLATVGMETCVVTGRPLALNGDITRKRPLETTASNDGHCASLAGKTEGDVVDLPRVGKSAAVISESHRNDLAANTTSGGSVRLLTDCKPAYEARFDDLMFGSEDNETSAATVPAVVAADVRQTAAEPAPRTYVQPPSTTATASGGSAPAHMHSSVPSIRSLAPAIVTPVQTEAAKPSAAEPAAVRQSLLSPEPSSVVPQPSSSGAAAAHAAASSQVIKRTAATLPREGCSNGEDAAASRQQGVVSFFDLLKGLDD